MLDSSAQSASQTRNHEATASMSAGEEVKEQDDHVKMKKAKPKSSNLKHSYTIPCTSQFRDRVSHLADQKKVNVADLARSVLLMVSDADISAFADPGDPDAQDRETVILKSGPSKGRPWRRKPRLQVRMAPGYDVLHIRKALNLALYMEEGKAEVRVHTEESLRAQKAELEAMKKQVEEQAKAQNNIHNLPETIEEMERLRAIVSVLSFEPLHEGVQDRSDALHILGFPPKTYPGRSELTARFRMLATIHHPDGKYGSHERMSQLNQAMAILRSAS
ncbi:J domain-containing protein [Terasakiella sp. A23]|uniref:J domain-containing protein n=1 Tax=Terasakiella sp. FCG-A23 TaxID=3080561 RepID=UPI0029559DD4|nr:J domain-containing protein [Terasakiella sp. A23]MDV7340872.1 J domain-containing protein [Terasakiella sp. A23]